LDIEKEKEKGSTSNDVAVRAHKPCRKTSAMKRGADSVAESHDTVAKCVFYWVSQSSERID
jgi:hypothetical protein